MVLLLLFGFRDALSVSTVGSLSIQDSVYIYLKIPAAPERRRAFEHVRVSILFDAIGTMDTQTESRFLGLTSFAHMVWGTQSEAKVPIHELSHNKAMRLVNMLNSHKTSTIDIPRIVVVGTQSSGKSSLLNGVLGMQIMPTGKEMVTRAPLDIRLIRSDLRRAVFSESGVEIELSDPPTTEQTTEIARTIERETVKRAGKMKGITAVAIQLTIEAPNVPELSMVDLPGLTMVACTDKGQPKDIKDQINRIVLEYMAPERTIICCVMAARPDLEADMALELVKRIDPDGERTIGIITKPDLMETNADVAAYLKGEVSRDLRLGLGYYAVRNAERRSHETEYFSTHPRYKHLKNRTGVDTVALKLSAHLASQVRTSLPRVCREIDAETQQNDADLAALGSPPPESEQDRRVCLNRTMLDFFAKLSVRIDSTESGCRIKELFCDYRDKIAMISKTNPVSRQEVEQLLTNFNGNHMDYSVCPITVLEKIVLDKGFRQFVDPSLELVSQTILTIATTIDQVAADTRMSERFPGLVAAIKDAVRDRVVERERALDSIEQLAAIESSYLWTDDPAFVAKLGKGRLTADSTLELVQLYMATVARTFEHLVPKIAMHHLVNAVARSGFYAISSADGILALLVEDPAIQDQRKVLVARRHKLANMKRAIQEAR